MSWRSTTSSFDQCSFWFPAQAYRLRRLRGNGPTPDFEALIARVAKALRRHDFAFMIIGGQAVLLHGEPGLTQDIDITLSALPDRLPTLLEVCAAAALEPLPEDGVDFVRRTFVVPAAARDTGIRVDFIFSSTP